MVSLNKSKKLLCNEAADIHTKVTKYHPTSAEISIFIFLDIIYIMK